MKKLLSIAAALALLMTPVWAAGETVATSFFPIYVFALNLTEGLEGVEVESLTAPDTGCLHDYQLQTGDMKLLDRADVFLINGAGMEGYLSHVLDAFPSLPVVDASAGVTLLESCTEHDHEADAEEHDHAHEINAHIWLDADNAIRMVTNLADGLMAELPEHTEAIAANRDRYIARLQALDAELESALADLPHRDIITFHEAFPYFAEAYGLHVAAVLNHDPEDTLSSRAVAELCNTVKQLGKPPLFIEPQYEDAAAQIVSRETGAAIYTLDPIVTGPEGAIPLAYYEDVMRQNARTLVEALGE